MKAITLKKYGPPDILTLSNIDRPTPKKDEVLVQVKAASLNAADWHIYRGTPFFARFSFGLFRPKNPVLGIDLSGIVESVGEDASAFKPGDEVFGSVYWGGAFAEFAAANPKRLALKPKNVSFEEAAAMPISGLTALKACTTGNITAGQRVLINGASGGVGTFMVQVTKAFGAHVTAVCGPSKKELTLALGADDVIDYTQTDFTQSNAKYDLIIDVVGNKKVTDYQQVLTPHGQCVIVGFTSLGLFFHHLVKGAWASRHSSQKIGLMETVGVNTKDLERFAALAEEGKVKSVIDRVYTLDKVPDAFRYMEEGHAAGKLVVRI